jgi:tetratricopeptide (TPR) repeat protein
MNTSVRSPAGALRLLLATAIVVPLAWRVVSTGVDALHAGNEVAAAQATDSPQKAASLEAAWRKRLAQNPSDSNALLALTLQMAANGDNKAARDAAAEVLRLAPNDQGALLQIGFLYESLGDEAPALAVFKRFVELYPDQTDHVWPMFTTALDGGRQNEFFIGAARADTPWWPGFIRHACANATAASIELMFKTRVSAGLAGPVERRCVLDRMQREGQWTTAYELWQSSLPPDQRESATLLFNGGFESPLSNIGFDWIAPRQDGVTVAPELTEGASGRRALHVTFVNKRYTGPPVYEYVLLAPGKYKFDGRGRADGLSSWLGMQWAIYCTDLKGGEGNQLAHSDPLVGSSDWAYFRQDFVVPKDCPVQVVRLELANPQRNTKTPGNVAVRLRGGVWFDDLRIGKLD